MYQYVKIVCAKQQHECMMQAVAYGTKYSGCKSEEGMPSQLQGFNTLQELEAFNMCTDNSSSNKAIDNPSLYYDVYHQMQNNPDSMTDLQENGQLKKLPILSSSVLNDLSASRNNQIVNNVMDNKFARSLTEPYVKITKDNIRKQLPSLEKALCFPSTFVASTKRKVSQVNRLPPLALFHNSTPAELQRWTTLNPGEGTSHSVQGPLLTEKLVQIAFIFIAFFQVF